MTLSGKSDRPKRWWRLPLIVTIAVVVLVGALLYALVTGIRFF